MKTEGKYIGYITSIESSALVWSDDLDEIKNMWTFGTSIFESNGLNNVDLLKMFPKKPKRGVILEYLKNNKDLIYRDGHMIGELTAIDLREDKLNKLNKIS